MSDVSGAPSPMLQQQLEQSANSAKQANASQMSMDSAFSNLAEKGTKGFSNAITKGGDTNLVEDFGSSPLASTTGGKLNAFEGMQTASVAPPMSGNVMTPPSLQHNAAGLNKSQGQGH